MILNILVKKSLPILALGIGFSFAIIVGFSNVDIIPLHINIHGEVDNYGSKWELFILPAIALLIYLLMWWLERNPQLYNFPSSKKHSRKEQEKKRSRTYQLAESNYCSNVCSNRNIDDYKSLPCTLDNFILHCSVTLCLH